MYISTYTVTSATVALLNIVPQGSVVGSAAVHVYTEDVEGELTVIFNVKTHIYGSHPGAYTCVSMMFNVKTHIYGGHPGAYTCVSIIFNV